MKELWNRVLLADMVDTNTKFVDVSGISWMEVAVLIMVGLMVVFAAFAIFFIHRQKKKAVEDEQRKEEEERKKDEHGGYV